MSTTIMNDIFKLSTSSKQTYRKRERNQSSRMVSAHSHGNHLLTLPSSESKRTKTTWEDWALHLRGEVLLSGHRALLEGSSAMASSKHLQISYQSYAGSHSWVSPAWIPVMKPGGWWAEIQFQGVMSTWMNWWPAPHPGVVAALQLGFRL